MVELKIRLETIEKVYSFVATVTKYEYDRTLSAADTL